MAKETKGNTKTMWTILENKSFQACSTYETDSKSILFNPDWILKFITYLNLRTALLIKPLFCELGYC